jgi:phage baseplate assembly protein W
MADRHLLTDIRLELLHRRLRPVYRAAQREVRAPGRTERRADLTTIAGRDNLGQAVVMRLLTPRGELAPLGHPEYGSRLHELVGRENTQLTRNLVKLYVLDALQFEPRIEREVDVLVQADPVTRSRVNVELRVRPVTATGTVTIGPFTLELGP